MDFGEKLLELLLEYIDEGIHVIDREEKTVIYNKAMEKLEGFDGSEVIGKKILEVFPSLNENTSTLCKVLKTGEPMLERYQSYINNKKGYNITAVNTTLPIKNGEEVIGAVEITKDFTRIKELYDRIFHLTEKTVLKEKNDNTLTFDDIIGCSPVFLRSVETARRAAKSSSSVLIYGETGTGKEVFARCIHNESKRSNNPFIGVNCAALPETLLESILFGTVKGGFTGAVDRPGLFEQANEGTLLLDEINSMPKGLQAKLLRALQEGYIRRLGDIKDIPVNVRVIATTNEEPYKAIANGLLRSDLYYRLSVVDIKVPRLCDRKDDIQLFVKQLIKTYNMEFSKDVWDISNEVYDAFMSYDWPGNVRELKNYIEGAMNMVSGHIINREHFSYQVQDKLFKIKDELIHENSHIITELKVSLDEHVENIEKDIIRNALLACNNNVSRTARMLKIKRQTLQHKIKKYKIE